MQIGFEKERLLRKRYAPASISAANTANPFANNTTKTQNQRAPRNQLSLPSRQPTTEHLIPAATGRSANERSASWVGSADPTFVEDFSRLRMTASQRHPKSVSFLEIRILNLSTLIFSTHDNRLLQNGKDPSLRPPTTILLRPLDAKCLQRRRWRRNF